MDSGRTQPLAKTLSFCFAGTLLLRLANSTTGVLMGLILARLDRAGGDISANTVGLLAAAFYLAELLGAPWFGVQSDRYGRRRFMILGPVFGGIAIQLIGWPGILLAMGVGRVLEGLSTASSAPSTLSFLSAATAGAPELRGRVMAWYEMVTLVGIAGGFIAGGLVWELLGPMAFLLVTVLYAASLAAFFFVRDVGDGDGGPGQRPAMGSLVRRPRLLRFVPAWLMVNTIVGVWVTHSAFQLTGESREGQYLPGALGGAGLSAGFGIFALAFLLGIYLWGMAIGRHRKTNILAVTLLGMYATCLALWLINHASEGDPLRFLALGGLFAAGIVLASGFTPAALAYLADISEETPQARGAIMGLYSVMLGIGQFGGGLLGGPFAEAASIDGLVLLTVLLATGALGTVLALRRFEGSMALAA